MKYVNSISELKKLCGGLHLFEPLPTIVIVEDLSIIIDPLSSVSKNDSKFLESVITITSIIEDAIDNITQVSNSTNKSLSVPVSVTATSSISASASVLATVSASEIEADDSCNQNCNSIELIITDETMENNYLQVISRIIGTQLKLQRRSRDTYSLVQLSNYRNPHDFVVVFDEIVLSSNKLIVN